MKRLRESKFLYNPYQIYKYLIYYPFLGMSTTFFGFLGAFLSIFNENIGAAAPVLWGKLNAWVTPMFVKVEGKANAKKGQSYVVVANHQSHFDIFIIYGWLPVNFRWVIKSQLRKAPVLGYTCYKMGHVFVDRSNPEVAKRSIEEAKPKIHNGTSIMFFPEGTRSNDGELLPLKQGAFRFAIELGIPILPVTITGSKNVLPNQTTSLFPGKAKMIIHDAIDIDNYDISTIRDLMEKAKESIQKGLDDNPEYQ